MQLQFLFVVMVTEAIFDNYFSGARVALFISLLAVRQISLKKSLKNLFFIIIKSEKNYKMVLYCEINSCVNNRATKSCNTLFRISNQNKSKWIAYIREQNKLRSFEPIQATRVCALHFEDCFLASKGERQVLSKLAYPGKASKDDEDVIFELKSGLKKKLDLKGWFFDEENLSIFNLKQYRVEYLLKFNEQKIVEVRKNDHLLFRRSVATYSEVIFLK